MELNEVLKIRNGRNFIILKQRTWLPMQEVKRHGIDPWVGKILWRREWQPTPVFLPEKSHRQRSLAGYSPRIAELDTSKTVSGETQQFSI